MEMLSGDAEPIWNATDAQVRKLKRVEYEHLAKQGFFDDERVELLFGMVVPMAPIDQEHNNSVRRTHEALLQQIAKRAVVYVQSSFAASDESEPQPDIYVVAEERWHDVPERALLVVEISNTAIKRDRAKRTLYGRAEVDEYWIVNHEDACVEVYRERNDQGWQHTSIHRRGETISPVAFPDVVIAVAEILPPA